MKKIILISCALMLGACSQTAEKIETAANRSATSWALGKPYSQVAALGTRPIDQLAANPTGYGQMIGSTSLADGSVLYRHIAPGVEQTSSVTTTGGLVGSNTTITNYRLSYFKVSSDGIVRDWATGSVPGTFSKCISYIGGIFQKCTDQGLVQQTLAAYDNTVRTSSKAGIQSWGPIAPTTQSTGQSILQ